MPKFQNQTISFLTKRFREVGIRPVSRHGQNFLIDMNILDLIVRSADLGPQDVVLEIGTGTGSLTTRMAAEAGHVITVEIDEHLHTLASEELFEFDNVTMLQFDVLKNKNAFRPEVMETIKEKIAEIPGGRLKLSANLPYNVATPIISNLLRTEIIPYSMTATIQKEVAERIIAQPSTKDYGALSVWLQSQCRCEIVRILPPSVFWPRPKIDSAIVQLVVDDELRGRIPDLEFFHTFSRAIFFHRRKFLRSVLMSAFKDRLEKSQVDEVIAENGLQPDARAEQFTPDEVLAMSEMFRQKLLSLGK
ncbi:16S rRNA (adenine(1518)-N(6)/adenine(1519)-N(6))-dimethyltransferase RsmA [Blastopirellula sp. JC732]|uniref:Ribosomal RNA small subunit methyltransferase A n=1 Tax=Blastopirellula sediminis TaxID=2894196 RepID=A0A9X1MT88_9BACT|nr:16S rRNA (adenine(1518)-N(6)/adenine(1519)-N(6))-dimethyltransferase RsmA [Blastopirellula sediminis]MCC9604716.1 16S rRNA (adenine(1518)-N(6)/adenine(1519)-N(6))-dimethyltransferase RsmA [Blastopirellula sediminis]MCC9631985.1 16S rRNA (adenine(1518)-N(6)/adenine(1519)-N(6))-dimethyltransferase RsmA [Blastopirellula sediminis]